ncbi:carboxy terminal-processing peptidase [Vreelandella utahensis]|uniref:carboxy terminal-processing peptidase n=1 Tax=Vreelandella halophila TaxID=86177 RepID=UPI000987A58E|nr:carboxy terminal-processing peptidase [Halomonas utahensis]
MRTQIFSSLFLALALLVTGAAQANLETERDYQSVEPTSDQARANILIARQLQFGHFKEQDIDGELASETLDAYLDQLDGQRLYFTQGDIDRFDDYRDSIQRALTSGNLEPAFRIYNHFQQRSIQRLEYALSLLDDGIDTFSFKSDDRYKLDRSEADWAQDTDELDQLWQDRIRNAVLSMRLDGQPDEAIKETLTRRYESQLDRAYDARSEDAFQQWMNAFAGLWDPHTQYLSPRNSENFDINMSLSLEGIGAVLQSEDGYTKVSRIVPGGPAAEEGSLGAADRIVGVAQADEKMKNVIGWRLSEVVDLIRGPKGSKVRLEVIPAGTQNDMNTHEITIVRDEVKLEEQSAQSDMIEMENGGEPWQLGVVDIPTFYADLKAARQGDEDYRSTTRDVRALLEDLKSDGMDGLVIDLRGNGGGALSEANQLVGLFIENGPTVQVRGPDGSVQVFEDESNNVTWDGPVVVLVNNLSASASEIFAGAMQDYGRGLVVGAQTFGKGTVQAIRPLNHGQLKITQSKFYRVSGASTQNRGVVPDIEIEDRIQRENVAESALDGALTWDEIDTLDYHRYFEFGDILQTITEKHENRFSEVPEYQLRQRELELLNERRDRTWVSLNAEERRADQEDFRDKQLSIVNRRRELQDKEPFDSWQAYEEDAESRPAMARRSQLADEGPDFVVREAGAILTDLLAQSEHYASIYHETPEEGAVAGE